MDLNPFLNTPIFHLSHYIPLFGMIITVAITYKSFFYVVPSKSFPLQAPLTAKWTVVVKRWFFLQQTLSILHPLPFHNSNLQIMVFLPPLMVE